MAHHIQFEEGVESELVEASFWHDRQQAGLGDRFLVAVFDTFDRIAEMPLAYPRVRGEIRRALVRPFLYVVYFRVDGDAVSILGVIHGSRHPDHWQTRS